MCTLYITNIIDVLFIYVSFSLIANYEVLSRAFENVGHEEKHQNGISIYMLVHNTWDNIKSHRENIENHILNDWMTDWNLIQFHIPTS